MLDEEMGRRFFEQAMEFWIKPEIKRRHDEGRLPQGFSLWAAQVMFDPPGGGPPEVRLNKEVRGTFEVSVSRDVDINKGTISLEEIEKLKKINLPEEELDRGHLTMILVKGFWRIGFDLRYNKRKVRSVIVAAREYLDYARQAIVEHKHRLSLDLAFAAGELSAKGFLMTEPLEIPKRHKRILSRYSMHEDLGNVPTGFGRALNRLIKRRDMARYRPYEHKITEQEALSAIELSQQMLSHTEGRVQDIL